ncbi:MATE family efflux transporter [Anaeromassilibacillus sp. An172]|uniref:MATE family efflux transporter n=1 Tax=Anaeromassilibacillus sp. An172 TaxID=1965570 RepID=UPI000B392145|nr:MATE family efflux transporter [Anaeromassilibacillus sp. An172]OUP79309.1 MATE family efflux transporter [Anaeromassilibacillus sp. An172]
MSQNIKKKTISADKMGSTPMLRLILSMSLPTMFSMIIQAMYNIVDSVFVSSLGQDALTALSLAYPLQLMTISVAVGTGVGINSFISRRLGEKNQELANNGAANGIFISIISWLVFLLVGIFLTVPFFKLFNPTPGVMKYGVDYTSIILIFSVGVMVEIAIEKVLQATGNMIFPMIFQLIGAVTNIVLDPLFIFGIGPFPRMEVAGAAIATVIGQILAMLFAIYIFFFKKHAVQVHVRNFKPSLKIIKNIYAVGFPSIIMQSISSVLVVGLNAILMGFSEAAVSVHGIYYKMQSFVFMPVFGLNQGLMPIMGYNFGAKNKDRLHSAIRYGCIIAAFIMLCGTVIFWVFPAQILSLFNANDDILNMGIMAMRFISLSFLPAAIDIIFSTTFQAVGKGFSSMILSLLRQLVFILPAALVLSNFGVNAVWFAYPIAEVGALIVAIFLYTRINKKVFSKLQPGVPIADI